MKQNIIPAKAIEKPRKMSTLFINNPNIGVIDTETFLSMDGTQKIYALGFKTNLAKDPIVYYIKKVRPPPWGGLDLLLIFLAVISTFFFST